MFGLLNNLTTQSRVKRLKENAFKTPGRSWRSWKPRQRANSHARHDQITECTKDVAKLQETQTLEWNELSLWKNWIMLISSSFNPAAVISKLISFFFFFFFFSLNKFAYLSRAPHEGLETWTDQPLICPEGQTSLQLKPFKSQKQKKKKRLYLTLPWCLQITDKIAVRCI